MSTSLPRLVRAGVVILIATRVGGAPRSFAGDIATEEARFTMPVEGVYLGVKLRDAVDGVEVLDVDSGSPADAAGIERSDIVVALDGEAVTDGTRGIVARIVRGGRRTIELRVRRRAEEFDCEATLGSDIQRTGARLAETVMGHRGFGRSRRESARAAAARVLEVAATAESWSEAFERYNDAIGAIGVSHTAVIPPWTYETFLAGEQDAEARRHTGFFLMTLRVDDEPHRFVRTIMHGSPAARCGLLVGDEVVSVNSIPIDESPRLVLAGFEASHHRHAVRVDDGETIELGVRRERGGPIVPLTIGCDVPLSGLGSTLESVERTDVPEGALGYIHFWNLLGRDLPRLVERLLARELATARGIVVDLRGRGGRLDVTLALARILLEDGRPLAVLIDSESRSAKEVLAWKLRGHEGVRLFGERTAGAVVPGGYAELPRGVRVMLPYDRREVLKALDGVDLEGQGVAPDVEVPARIPWAAGRDPIREAGEAWLRDAVGSRPRRLSV